MAPKMKLVAPVRPRSYIKEKASRTPEKRDKEPGRKSDVEGALLKFLKDSEEEDLLNESLHSGLQDSLPRRHSDNVSSAQNSATDSMSNDFSVDANPDGKDVDRSRRSTRSSAKASSSSLRPPKSPGRLSERSSKRGVRRTMSEESENSLPEMPTTTDEKSERPVRRSRKSTVLNSPDEDGEERPRSISRSGPRSHSSSRPRLARSKSLDVSEDDDDTAQGASRTLDRTKSLSSHMGENTRTEASQRRRRTSASVGGAIPADEEDDPSMMDVRSISSGPSSLRRSVSRGRISRMKSESAVSQTDRYDRSQRRNRTLADVSAHSTDDDDVENPDPTSRKAPPRRAPSDKSPGRYSSRTAIRGGLHRTKSESITNENPAIVDDDDEEDEENYEGSPGGTLKVTGVTGQAARGLDAGPLNALINPGQVQRRGSLGASNVAAQSVQRRGSLGASNVAAQAVQRRGSLGASKVAMQSQRRGSLSGSTRNSSSFGGEGGGFMTNSSDHHHDPNDEDRNFLNARRQCQEEILNHAQRMRNTNSKTSTSLFKDNDSNFYDLTHGDDDEEFMYTDQKRGPLARLKSGISKTRRVTKNTAKGTVSCVKDPKQLAMKVGGFAKDLGKETGKILLDPKLAAMTAVSLGKEVGKGVAMGGLGLTKTVARTGLDATSLVVGGAGKVVTGATGLIFKHSNDDEEMDKEYDASGLSDRRVGGPSLLDRFADEESTTPSQPPSSDGGGGGLSSTTNVSDSTRRKSTSNSRIKSYVPTLVVGNGTNQGWDY